METPELYLYCPHSEGCRIYSDWAKQGNEQVDVIGANWDGGFVFNCLALEDLKSNELRQVFKKRFKQEPSCAYLYQLSKKL